MRGRRGLGSRMIPHNRPTLGPEEERAVRRVLESGWLAQGVEVEAFENELCAYLGLPGGHAVATSSGTSALFLALWALDAKGARVACPVYACSALTNAIALAGAMPVLINSAPDDPNVDTDALAGSVADIALVPHMFGLPVDLAKLNAMPVIEDCAQALGTCVGGRRVGTQGTIGIFSFYATKMITSGGQGGMLVSRDRAIVDAVRDFREFDRRDDREPRFNFQMTDVQAAVGREQLRKLPSFIERRSEIFAKYRDEGLEIVEADRAASPVRFRSVIRSAEPRALIERLAQRGVRAIVPVEDWELLGPAEQFPQSAGFARTTVSLPTYPSLQDKDLLHVVELLRAIASEKSSMLRIAS